MQQMSYLISYKNTDRSYKKCHRDRNAHRKYADDLRLMNANKYVIL